MSRSLLIPTYAALAIGALIATWSFNLAYLVHGGSLINFFSDGYANDAAGSLTNDILFVTATAFVFMFIDARRTGVRHVWIYMMLSLAIATSVALPVYLIARERALMQSSTN
jgi:hypothetical protein